jgi:hypothetical protein
MILFFKHLEQNLEIWSTADVFPSPSKVSSENRSTVLLGITSNETLKAYSNIVIWAGAMKN